MPRCRLRTLVGGAFVVFALAASEPARAQADDAQRAAARGFANDGLTAYNAGQYEKAIELFSRAEALVHAPPHLLFIARASVKTGKLVHAKELYVKIAREELAETAPKAFVEAQAAAAAEEAEVAPRIGKLTIAIQGAGAESATVTMDGVVVPRALIGVAQPADPGAHKLHAEAKGWRAADTSVTLEERGAATATLTLDTPTKVEEPAPVVVSGNEPGAFRRLSPLLAFGVGVMGLAVGTVFLLKNHGDRDQADELCPNGQCPASRRGDIQSFDDSANEARTFSWIGYGVGAAGIVTGALLVLWNRSSSAAPKTGTTVLPWISAGSAGLTGRF